MDGQPSDASQPHKTALLVQKHELFGCLSSFVEPIFTVSGTHWLDRFLIFFFGDAIKRQLGLGAA